ncbi:hypothetical protein H6792_02520 [Candidatus Nomurabacteria bacterium]|nr:hypothetical protein [Candidatus Nomurabacteria bacterium]
MAIRLALFLQPFVNIDPKNNDRTSHTLLSIEDLRKDLQANQGDKLISGYHDVVYWKIDLEYLKLKIKFLINNIDQDKLNTFISRLSDILDNPNTHRHPGQVARQSFFRRLIASSK